MRPPAEPAGTSRFAALGKFLLKVPKLLLSLAKRISKAIWKQLERFVLLPTDTLSGKLWVVTVFCLGVTFVGAVLWALGVWQESVRWVEVGLTVLTYVGSGLALSAGLFLIAYPLDRSGWLSEILVGSGILQLSRSETGALAIGVGFVVTVTFTSIAIWGYAFVTETTVTLGTLDLRLFLPGVVTLFAGTTFLSFYIFQQRKKLHIRDDLAVISVTESESGEQTATLQNQSGETIDLWQAKFKDSDGEIFKLTGEPTVRPGEKTTLTLPPEFALETIDSVPRGLGLFLEEKRVATVYTRHGNTYVLEWHGEDELVSPQPGRPADQVKQ